MKKQLSIILMATIIILTPLIAFAGWKGGSSKGNVTTIKDFANECLKSTGGGLGGLIDLGVGAAKCDDKNFTMEGNLTGQLRRNIYTFKDETGSMYVEIDDFRGVDVGPEDKIRLSGEADYDDGELFLDVYRLELVK